ncbi:MAG: type IV toxin-antitoxin system AbiEi family antitoxin domain-containing protein [Anaerohalosphaeraceae bacterium]|nr:type IV toxin-antitoxin system AbiEi family antitoxin domain-containing protein [Anaerohalosphaeraceae bacterium]
MINVRRNGTSQNVKLGQRVLAMAREKGILRTQDLIVAGIPRVVLTRLCRSKRLNRLSRGLYALPETDITENHSLAEVSRRIPHAIICLLSALRFHRLTTQAPFEVWIAIDAKTRKPRVKDMPLRIVRFCGQNRTHGVEEHVVENVTIRVTSAARTVADCFKYRNKIGLDVALESLKEYRRERKSRDELWRAARVCRVASVMRPYMEAMA